MTENKFVDLIGNYIQTRIFDLFLKNPETEYSLKEIIKDAKGDYTSAYAFVSKLIDKKYIKKCIRDEKSVEEEGVVEEDVKYRANLENSVMKQLIEINWGNDSNSH